MTPFMDRDFLLESDTARDLYHSFAEGLPLFDYHCHLPAREIAENKPFATLGELWLAHDHYKWRLLRSCGIAEELITGSAPWREKYRAFASALPQAIGNPLHHWTHLELQRYFNIAEPLNAKSAETIWDRTSEMLADGKYTPAHFIEASNVDTVGTTDDPADTLEWHAKIASGTLRARVIPSWRPDRAMQADAPDYPDYIAALADAAGVCITDFDSLLRALDRRMDAFADAGCVASDHDMPVVFHRISDAEAADRIFRKALLREALTAEEIDVFKATLLCRMCAGYHRRDWVMQLHIGCDRSVNAAGAEKIGRASGFDSPGDREIAAPLGALLNALATRGILPKTVLYCLNPKDNWVLASLAATFQTEGTPSRIQFGTAWWMQDHLPGMRSQMEALANTGVLGHFIGMLTDSRSYLSYTRFEYFRRILCNYLGSLVEAGQYPADRETLGEIVRNIGYFNAKRYFGRGGR